MGVFDNDNTKVTNVRELVYLTNNSPALIQFREFLRLPKIRVKNELLSPVSDEEIKRREKARQERKANEWLSKNQHLWDWTTPYMNTSSTNKQNAEARFNFNADATQSIPKVAAVAAMLTNPLASAAAIAGGELGSAVTNGALKLITGKNWEDNLHDITGIDRNAARVYNPGGLIGAGIGLRGIGTLQRGVLQDRLLGRNYDLRDKDIYLQTYGRDISELLNQTVPRAILKGSPNLGYAFPLFSKDNPLYHWGKGTKTRALMELANYTLPFLPPIFKSAVRAIGGNVASLSANYSRTVFPRLTTIFRKGDNYGGINKHDDTKAFNELIQKYPKLDFVKYYLWRHDPILRWTPSVRLTSKYFKENPAPIKVSFGEKYDLYGDLPQGEMPVVNKTIDLNFGQANMLKYKDPNKWVDAMEFTNPTTPIINIAGHQMYIDPKNSSLISKDIWKFNPWDYYKKWIIDNNNARIINYRDKLLMALPAIMDKLGKPFITVSHAMFTPKASLYLENMYENPILHY